MSQCIARWRGTQEYSHIVNEMSAFTDSRTIKTADELWFLQHSPVFTQGTSCKTKPRKNPSDIPLIHSNRGGQITYHGPGQLITYLMLDLKRLGIGPKALVSGLETCVINLLQEYGVDADRQDNAPGVYVKGAKIAALGLRIRNGRCFHGMSLNIDMNLEPFDWIDPCGYPGLEVTRLMDHVSDPNYNLTIEYISNRLLNCLKNLFQWDSVSIS